MLEVRGVRDFTVLTSRGEDTLPRIADFAREISGRLDSMLIRRGNGAINFHVGYFWLRWFRFFISMDNGYDTDFHP